MLLIWTELNFVIWQRSNSQLTPMFCYAPHVAPPFSLEDAVKIINSLPFLLLLQLDSFLLPFIAIPPYDKILELSGSKNFFQMINPNIQIIEFILKRVEKFGIRRIYWSPVFSPLPVMPFYIFFFNLMDHMVFNAIFNTISAIL